MTEVKAPTLDRLLQERSHRIERVRMARPGSWQNEILVRGHPRGLPLREMMEQIVIDPDADARLTVPGRDALTKRYMSAGTDFVPQDVFRRVAAWYSDDAEMAQRVYGYIARHWFMPATPVLTNGGTDRGLPISCYLNDTDDTISSIIDQWKETALLSSKGGGVGTSYDRLRAIGEATRGGKTSGAVSFAKVEDSVTLAISQGDPMIFFTQPISASVLALTAVLLIAPAVWKRVNAKKQANASAREASAST